MKQVTFFRWIFLKLVDLTIVCSKSILSSTLLHEIGGKKWESPAGLQQQYSSSGFLGKNWFWALRKGPPVLFCVIYTTLRKTNMVHLKIAPWNTRLRTWTPSFLRFHVFNLESVPFITRMMMEPLKTFSNQAAVEPWKVQKISGFFGPGFGHVFFVVLLMVQESCTSWGW